MNNFFIFAFDDTPHGGMGDYLAQVEWQGTLREFVAQLASHDETLDMLYISYRHVQIAAIEDKKLRSICSLEYTPDQSERYAMEAAAAEWWFVHE